MRIFKKSAAVVIAAVMSLQIVCLSADLGGRKVEFAGYVKGQDYTQPLTPFTTLDENFDIGLKEYLSPNGYPTTFERFQSSVSELPIEMSVVKPFEIKGGMKVYVSPDGNAGGDGSLEKPFGSIEKALKFVDKADFSKKKDGVVVFLRGGDYGLTDSVKITNSLSGTSGKPFIISAYPGETPTLLGGSTIDSKAFANVTDINKIKRLQPLAREHVMEVDLKQLGINDYGRISALKTDPETMLYVNGEPMTLARWPNSETTYVEKYLRQWIKDGNEDFRTSSEPGFEFEYLTDRPSGWLNTGDLWMFGSFFAEWDRLRIKIKEINLAKHSISSANDAGYGVRPGAGNRYYYANVFEELDTPGEWYLDRADGKLYLFPPCDMNNALIQLATGDFPLIDIKGAKDIAINGLTLKNNSAAGVYISDGFRNIVQNCEIANVGTDGVAIVDNSYQCGAVNNRIENTNGAFVRLDRENDLSDFQALRTSRNFVQNNFFSGCRGNYGLYLYGYGNVVSHNIFMNATASGIFGVLSEESIIEYNEFVFTARDTDDCGAIYIGGNLYNRANHVRYNYIHDNNPNAKTGLSSGIYMDDMCPGNYAYGNTINNVVTAIKSHNGREVTMFNNVIMNSPPESNAVAMTDEPNYARRGFGIQRVVNGYIADLVWRRAFEPRTGNYFSRNPTVAPLIDVMLKVRDDINKNGEYDSPLVKFMLETRDFVSGNNLIYKHGEIHFSDFAKPTIAGLDTNYKTDINPGFYDEKNGDVAIKPNSKIFDKIPGFFAPPVRKAGNVAADGTTAEKIEIAKLEPVSPIDKSVSLYSHEKVSFSWTQGGANSYELTVATDPEFKEIVSHGEIMDTRTVLDLPKAGKTYYWKVVPKTYSANIKLADNFVAPIWSFTTFTNEEIAKFSKPDTWMLSKDIAAAQEIADNIKEGTGRGEYAEGVKEDFQKAIAHAARVRDAAKLQGVVDTQRETLAAYLAGIYKRQSRTVFDMSGMTVSQWSIPGDQAGIGKIVSVTDGKAEIRPSSQVSYGRVNAGDILHFKLRSGTHDGFGIAKTTDDKFSIWDIKSVRTELVYFSGTGYELQRLLNKQEILANNSYDNAPFTANEWHDIVFSAQPVEQGLWIVFMVDGKTVFNMIDTGMENMGDGYLTLMPSSVLTEIAPGGDLEFTLPEMPK